MTPEVDPNPSPPDLNEDIGEELKVCVGVHFGITHTGVAYIVRGAVDFPSSLTEALASVQDVEAIQNLPKCSAHSKADLYCQDGDDLQNLRDYIESQIRRQYSDQCALKFRYAVGVPAHWPSDAKLTLLDSAVALPELEAATMGALYDPGLAVTTDDVLMVCDAGGDTVDLCSYEFTYQKGQAGILHPLYDSAHINDNALGEFEDGCPQTRSQPRRMVLWNDRVPGQVGGVRKVMDMIPMLVSKHIRRVRGLKSGGVMIKLLLFSQNQSLIQALTKVCRDAGNIQVYCPHDFEDAVTRGLALHLMRDEDEKLRDVTIGTGRR